MAFSGMRAGEVLQLSVRDLRKEGELAYFDVNEASDDKTVKNGQRRHVPVHPALVA